jgi:hypothetical protein
MPSKPLRFRHRRFPERQRLVAIFLLLNALALIAICIAAEVLILG